MKKINILISLLLFCFISISTLSANPINPFINSVSPLMNAVSVNKSSNITITFTQGMNSSTVNSANIKVFGYQTGLLAVTIDYDLISKTANINPNQDLKVGEKIAITLTSGLKTISNENITPFVFSFIVQTIGGNGYFTKTSSIEYSEGYVIKSGDIDGDGNIDLLINNNIYKNNGLSQFNYFSTLSELGSPELADFDSDGDLDILISNNNILYYYQNNGEGIFNQINTFTGYTGAIGDLNGDGFLDVSYFLNTQDIEILKNVNGVFSSDTIIHSENGADLIDNLTIDDFNNDGMLDILGVSFSYFQIFGFFDIDRFFNELRNMGNNEFNIHSVYTDHFDQVGSVGIFMQNSNTADINNNNYIDIISPSKNIDNNGLGVFTFLSGNILFSNSKTGDFNGDGKIDFIANGFGSPLQSNINTGAGDFERFIGNNGAFTTSCASADFDNDGDLDVAIKEYGNTEIAILLNGDIPLPAELTSFTSSVNSNNISLNWSTSSEENNSGFEIERSSVKEVWEKISFVQGSGNSNSEKNYSFTDRNLNTGKYKYRLKQIDYNGNFKYYNLQNEVIIGSPKEFELSQNYPNPFNPSTKISFNLPEHSKVTLKVFDISGKEIATLVNENLNAGYYTKEFSSIGALPSGIYFYSLSIDGKVMDTKRMVLLK